MITVTLIIFSNLLKFTEAENQWNLLKSQFPDQTSNKLAGDHHDHHRSDSDRYSFETVSRYRRYCSTCMMPVRFGGWASSRRWECYNLSDRYQPWYLMQSSSSWVFFVRSKSAFDPLHLLGTVSLILNQENFLKDWKSRKYLF